ncbi:hypothetical protein PUNSTDRAFT_40215, partial [Punctularia strigosozonata HHB-11173 SS5]|uniref:uncharacterized protein n=1 Tax=Punctularia strigosozonata (strain HHB-11173) TaxID=741275 RepID=UPI00044177C2
LRMVLVIATMLSLALAVSGIKGDKFCGNLMCVAAIVNGSTTTYGLTSLNQLGWMAMGFGPVMANTSMVIVWPDSDGTIVMSQRKAPGEVEPSPDPTPLRGVATLLTQSIDLTESTPVVSFTVASNSDASEDLIWAYGFTPVDSSDPNAHLLQHQDAGNFTLDLTKDLAPTSTSGATASSSTSSQNPAQTGSKSSGGSNIGVDRSPRYRAIMLAHAALSALGFTLLLPLAGLVARWGRVYTPYWFKTHWLLNVILGMPIITIGFILAPLAAAERGGAHLKDAHQIGGVLLFLMYVAQCTLGYYIHARKPRERARQHPPRNILHIIFGLTTLGMAFWQV